MLRVFGFKRSLVVGWLFASCLIIFLTTSGCVISPRRSFGQGPTPTPTPTPSPTPTPTGTPSPTPTPTPSGTPQGKLYVSNSGNNAILRFDQAFTDSGNIIPAATISGAATTLNGPDFIFLDAANDRLFVANNNDISILIFDNISTKNGNVAPERTITGSSTTLVSPTDLTLDKSRDFLYVADGLDIEVFNSASTTTGNIAPARTLTPGFSVAAVFVDGANDRLFVADSTGNSIEIYDNASTLANGPITASRTISGAATLLATPSSIQIDGSGRLVVSNANPPSMTIYSNAAAANGNVAPVATISGSNTALVSPNQIAIDTTSTGTLYIADPAASRIPIYSSFSTATGNIAPNRVITGPGTTLSGNLPVGVAIDTTR